MQTDFPPVRFLIGAGHCAADAAARRLEPGLGPEGVLFAPRWNSPLRAILGNRWSAVDPLALRRVHVVSGADLSVSLGRRFTGREIREHVLLRDPVSWLVAEWNRRKRRLDEEGEPAPPPFEDWARAQPRNPVSSFLLQDYLELGRPARYVLSSRARFERLERLLARVAFVGAWTGADDLVDRLSDDLGIARPARTSREDDGPLAVDDVPEALSEALQTDHALDQLLFDRWKDRGFDAAASPAPDAGAARTLSAADAFASFRADLARAAGR